MASLHVVHAGSGVWKTYQYCLYPPVISKPIRTPDIAELRAFCTAVDMGSLGKAARLLRVSQPALSKRLRTLEAIAGTRLVDRSSKGVSPTPAGARLYVEAQKLLAQAENVEGLITGLTADYAPVRLAASHTIAEFILPARLVEFESMHESHLCVELFIANTVVVRNLVSEGRADVGISAVAPDDKGNPGFTELPFCDDEVIVAVPKRHSWARKGEIELEDFIRTPMIMRDPQANTRRTVEAVIGAKGLALKPPLAEVGSTAAAKTAALTERTPALLSTLAVREATDSLIVRRVRGLRFPRRFTLAFSSEEALSPASRSLIDHLLKAPPHATGHNQ